MLLIVPSRHLGDKKNILFWLLTNFRNNYKLLRYSFSSLWQLIIYTTYTLKYIIRHHVSEEYSIKPPTFIDDRMNLHCDEKNGHALNAVHPSFNFIASAINNSSSHFHSIHHFLSPQRCRTVSELRICILCVTGRQGWSLA